MIPGPPPGTYAEDDAAGSEQPSSGALGWPAPALPVAATGLAYGDFVKAVKDALRDVHSPDLLTRNPLLRDGLCNLGGSAGPQELKALLCETVGTLFINARDEKLRRILDLTYSQPALKQEVVADRLALSFGTYRRHLTNARDRMARWLWETTRFAPIQSELPLSAGPTTTGTSAEGETPTASQTGEPVLRRLSVVVLPFLNIGGSAEDDPFVDGVTETLITDLSRSPGVFVTSRSSAFAYKGKPIDVREIGRELGVRYVLEGSVQNAGERMRFNAQLVDAESGGHLWAERFDKLSLALFHRCRRALSRASGSRDREPAQIGRDQSALGTFSVRPGRRASACRAARRGSRSPCGRAASGAQFHHCQVPRRSGERQPGLPRAERAFLSGTAVGVCPRRLAGCSPPGLSDEPAWPEALIRFTAPAACLDDAPYSQHWNE